MDMKCSIMLASNAIKIDWTDKYDEINLSNVHLTQLPFTVITLQYLAYFENSSGMHY